MTVKLSQFPEELIKSSSFHYGLMVISLGDDGDVAMILGHHNDRRAIAAFNRYSREECGLLGMFDDPSATYADAVVDLERRWAKLITRCAAADELWHSDECGLCSEIQRSIEQGGWWVQYNCTKDEPGVFPVMVWLA